MSHLSEFSQLAHPLIAMSVVNIIVGLFPLFVFFTFLCTWPYCAPFSYEGHAFVFLNKSGGTWDRRSLLQKI